MAKDELQRLLGQMFQAHPWHGISPGDQTGFVNAYIEIVPTDPVKYELDKPSGLLRIDRPHRFSSLPPNLYGFIPQTYCGEKVAQRAEEQTQRKGLKGDGDPLDIVVLTERVLSSGSFLARVRPIGGFRMIDREEADDKIVGILEADLEYGDVTELSLVRKPMVERLRHYFESYKQFPGEGKRKVEISEIYGSNEAREVIRRSIEDYQSHFGSPEERMERLYQLLRAGPPA